jgi:hypothetical protein
MKNWLTLFLFLLFGSHLWAQQLAPQDTIKATDRTFGDLRSLTQQMNGFGAAFFINPSSSIFDPIALYSPGFASMVDQQAYKKPLQFSALPHLGFAYGFGAQGSQRLRLDVEQSFAKRVLLNVRYDRWQRVGFIRSDDLRYSQLQINLHQAGQRHELLAQFGNVSDDRQWAGGIQDYNSLGSISTDLLPVVKETSRTQKNSYSAQIDFRYRLLGDSLHAFNLASQHRYQLNKRLYLEQEQLSLFYPQTYFSPDSCADRFEQNDLDNRLGISWNSPQLQLSSLLGLRQRSWSDVIAKHDTLELNWSNHLLIQRAEQRFAHQNEINFIGAAQGWHAMTNYQGQYKFWKFNVAHRIFNEWPLLMQRVYQSNLTNYFWSNPQKQFFQELSAASVFENTAKSLMAQFKLSVFQFKNVYRFDPQLVQWTTTGFASAGQFATLEASLNYSFGKAAQNASNKSWTLRSDYKFLAQQTAFLPKNRAALALAWHGGVFKDKRLKLFLEGQINYVSASRAVVYLPYIESLDWTSVQTGLSNQANLNAQLNLALEVKTFRFFINVANIGHFWTAPQISMVNGYTFPTMQVRLGLTWDFWN